MDWAARAACVGKDPDWFTPLNGDYSQGRKVCFVCPVSAACLAEALSREAKSGERFSLWGGLSPRERDVLIETGHFEQRIA